LYVLVTVSLIDAGYLSTVTAFDIKKVFFPNAIVIIKIFIKKYKTQDGNHIRIKMKRSKEEYELIQKLLFH
jgi:hypothetical protein